MEHTQSFCSHKDKYLQTSSLLQLCLISLH